MSRIASRGRSRIANAVAKQYGAKPMPLPKRPLPPRGQSPFGPAPTGARQFQLERKGAQMNKIRSRKKTGRQDQIQDVIRGMRPKGPASLY